MSWSAGATETVEAGASLTVDDRLAALSLVAM